MSGRLPANAHVSSHPCLRTKLSQLRSHSTGASDTKRLINDIALIVGCEALAQLQTAPSGNEKSPLGYEYVVEKLQPARVSIMPILRSGLGMVDAIQQILPEPVPIHHLGLFRDKSTLTAVEYYNNLPYHRFSSGDSADAGPSDLVVLVDPVIATGATARAAIDTLRDWGAKRVVMVSILASRDGITSAAEQWPEGLDIWTAGMDNECDEKGMIKPGLGDVGDRLFLTIGK